jgi:hypothetical protein
MVLGSCPVGWTLTWLGEVFFQARYSRDASRLSHTRYNSSIFTHPSHVVVLAVAMAGNLLLICQSVCLLWQRHGYGKLEAYQAACFNSGRASILAAAGEVGVA